MAQANNPGGKSDSQIGKPPQQTEELPSKWDEARGRILLKSETYTFTQVVTKEEELLKRDRWNNGQPKDDRRAQLPEKTPDDALVIADGHREEPWVRFRQEDRFGVALSGGGIRSATFNLGLLEALARPLTSDQRSLLAEVDYLSTVSGGGYVGGFWSRWRSHQRQHGAHDGPAFPQHAGGADAPGPEPEAIRHMRERSRFLMPRLGIFSADTWAGLIAVLAGTLPSLIVATAVLTLAWAVWVSTVHALYATPAIGGTVLALGAFLIQLITEMNWKHRKYGGTISAPYALFAAVVSAVIGVAWFLGSSKLADQLPSIIENGQWTMPVSTPWWTLELLGAQLIETAADEQWTVLTSTPWWIFFAPAAPWIAMSVLLLLGRAILSGFLRPPSTAVVERVTSRCLAPAVIWVALACLWAGALLVEPATATLPAAAGTAAAGGLFVWLRQWLTEPMRETRGGKLLERLVTALKPVLPQVLAYAAVVGMLVLVAMALFQLGRMDDWTALGHTLSPAIWACIGAAGTVAFVIVAVNPERLGLHEFYRSRIQGTFLGAASGHSAAPDDSHSDAKVSKLDGQRPIHLVCCTGNDLGSDPLPNLYRGGRSVTISPAAVLLGNDAARYDDLQLSSALTASAAAFNSQMGTFSMRLGPAVAFLMTALGLRLGLWLPHPSKGEQRRLFPGLDLFREMFGLSQAVPSSASGGGRPRDLHLSDGGHFENLALYELVRRHCRYLLVSDCGADAELAFDDLAVAIRLVREDFGVEIDLDVDPLRPDEQGFSQQHLVVGTIHYDGVQGTDKGIIIYFKPTLVGDEPPDVIQYRTRNPAFPHEGTSDQFYDESQWESYRRLGQHAAGVAFGFAAENGFADRRKATEWVFAESVQRWQRLRDVDADEIARLKQKRDELLARINDEAPASFRSELYAESARAMQQVVPIRRQPDEELAVLHHCASLASLMEQVWRAARLEVYWSHPINRPWMSLFGRIAATPSFRRWWILLRTGFADGFADFVKHRLGLRIRGGRATDPLAAAVELTITSCDAAAIETEPVYREWLRRTRFTQDPKTLRYFSYTLGWTEWRAGNPVVVGILAYQIDGDTARWGTNDLFVPKGLDGAGIISRFLDQALEELRPMPAINTLEVTVNDPGHVPADPDRPALADPAHRLGRLQLTQFYKSRDFSLGRDGKLRLQVKSAQSGSRALGPQPPETPQSTRDGTGGGAGE